jgi:uncharacterized protein (TIGR00255 family)
MILSMTGYASHELTTPNGALTMEIRSVNHRYLELQLKLDDQLRVFENNIREQIQAKLGRGKVDCRVYLKQDNLTTQFAAVNHQAIQQIANSMQEAAQYFPSVQPVDILEVLRIPGVTQSPRVDHEALEATIKTTLTDVLENLISARQREGEKLKAMILERLTEIDSLVISVKPMLPVLVQTYQDKLTAKLKEAMLADDERVRQEIVLYAQRIDVDEELSRLDAHVREVGHILAKGGAVGKKLDFLMQEMNREANTLGSKSVSIETTQISMKLKVLIEQMREQIQNIE